VAAAVHDHSACHAFSTDERGAAVAYRHAAAGAPGAVARLCLHLHAKVQRDRLASQIGRDEPGHDNSI
jgi:hypothetical protein